MKQKTNKAEAAAIGAVLAVPIVFFLQMAGSNLAGDGGFAFWGGVGLLGAAVGLLVGVIRDKGS